MTWVHPEKGRKCVVAGNLFQQHSFSSFFVKNVCLAMCD